MYKYSICGIESGHLRCYRRNDGGGLPGVRTSRLDCNKVASRVSANWTWSDLWDTGLQYQRDIGTRKQVIANVG